MKKTLFIAIAAFGLHAAHAQVRTIPQTGKIPQIKTLKNKTSDAFTRVVDSPAGLLDAWITDEEVLHIQSTAKISSARLQVFTPAELAVRKGTNHTYPFTTPVNAYQFNLKAPAYAGYLGYWVYITTEDGKQAEAFFRRK